MKKEKYFIATSELGDLLKGKEVSIRLVKSDPNKCIVLSIDPFEGAE